MNIFIVLSESPIKVRKIAVYCFLIPFFRSRVIKVETFEKRLKEWYEKCAVLDKINQN